MVEKTWVDFRKVKEAISMAAILEHYKIEKLRKSGDEVRGKCPLHNGEGERSFHVSGEIHRKLSQLIARKLIQPGEV